MRLDLLFFLHFVFHHTRFAVVALFVFIFLRKSDLTNPKEPTHELILKFLRVSCADESVYKCFGINPEGVVQGSGNTTIFSMFSS